MLLPPLGTDLPTDFPQVIYEAAPLRFVFPLYKFGTRFLLPLVQNPEINPVMHMCMWWPYTHLVIAVSLLTLKFTKLCHISSHT